MFKSKFNSRLISIASKAAFGLIAVSSVLARDKVKLSLDEAVQTGLGKSKTIAITNSKLASAKAKVKETEAAMYPSLKLAASYTRLSEVDPFTVKIPNGSGGFNSMSLSPAILNNYSAKLSLAQPIFTGNRLTATNELAELNAKAGGEDVKKDEQQIIYDIKNAYWNYYRSIESIKTIDSTLEQMRAHLKDIESFYKNGLGTLNDVLKVKVQLSNLEYTKIEAETGVAISLTLLNNAMGIAVSTEVETTSTPAELDRNSSKLDDLISEAYKTRNDIKAMDYRVQASQTGVKVSEAGWYPQVNFAANYTMANPNSRIQPAKEEFKGTWDLGLNISYDIWNWSTTSRQAEQAEQTLEQSRLTYNQMKDIAAMEITQNYLTVDKSKEKIPAARLTVEQAVENLRVTYEKFKGGLGTNSDLLDAETLLFSAKINMTTALVDLEIAKIRLDKSIGKLN